MTDVAPDSTDTSTAVRIASRSVRTAPVGPWPEPWRPAAHARPATDYWNCLDASWRCPPGTEPRG
jgi:hypothetical protein